MGVKADKQYPKCASKDYQFRARRNLLADPVKKTPAATETKYRCTACGHMWKLTIGRGNRTTA